MDRRFEDVTKAILKHLDSDVDNEETDKELGQSLHDANAETSSTSLKLPAAFFFSLHDKTCICVMRMHGMIMHEP